MADDYPPVGRERTEPSAVRHERRRATGDHPAATLGTRPQPVSRPGRRGGQSGGQTGGQGGGPIGAPMGGQGATAPVPEVAAPFSAPPDTFEEPPPPAPADAPLAAADLGPPPQLARGEPGRTAPSAVTLVVGGRLPRRQRRRLDQAARFRARQSDSRLRLVYDTRGPAVRLGLIWVGLLAGSLWLGQGALALLFAALAAVTSLQIAQAWRAVGIRPRPSRLLCALIGGLCPLAALGGSGGLGLAVVGSVVACVAGGAVLAHRARGARAPGALGIAFASATLRCGFFAGLAAGCVVLVHHVDAGAALVLVVLVCSYEAGDYLVGSGSTTALEGPAAGCIGVLVATFAVVVVRPDLFGGSASLWAMGVATGLACPLGQLAASAILPSGGTFAPALRRLDSYLVAAPLWAFVLLAGWVQVRPSLP